MIAGPGNHLTLISRDCRGLCKSCSQDINQFLRHIGNYHSLMMADGVPLIKVQDVKKETAKSYIIHLGVCKVNKRITIAWTGANLSSQALTLHKPSTAEKWDWKEHHLKASAHGFHMGTSQPKPGPWAAQGTAMGSFLVSDGSEGLRKYQLLRLCSLFCPQTPALLKSWNRDNDPDAVCERSSSGSYLYFKNKAKTKTKIHLNKNTKVNFFFF